MKGYTIYEEYGVEVCPECAQCLSNGEHHDPDVEARFHRAYDDLININDGRPVWVTVGDYKGDLLFDTRCAVCWMHTPGERWEATLREYRA